MLGQHLSLLMSKNTSTNSPCLKFGDVLLNRHRFQGLAITEWITLNASSYLMGNSKQHLHQFRSNKTESVTRTICLNGRDAWKRIESMILICFDCLNCPRERGKVLRNWEKKWKRERISHLFKSPQWRKKQWNSFIKTQCLWLWCLFPEHQLNPFSLILQ